MAESKIFLERYTIACECGTNITLSVYDKEIMCTCGEILCYKSSPIDGMDLQYKCETCHDIMEIPCGILDRCLTCSYYLEPHDIVWWMKLDPEEIVE